VQPIELVDPKVFKKVHLKMIGMSLLQAILKQIY